MASIRSTLGLVFAVLVTAKPIAVPNDDSLARRQASGQATNLLALSLPSNNILDSQVRTAAISVKRATFLYGPAPGAGPYYPTGALGTTYVAADSVIADGELAAQVLVTTNDSIVAKLQTYNGLKTLDDYTKLYDGQWEGSSKPTGDSPGILTNYTQDLLFSMERLSFNPFAVRRLDPDHDNLPFTVDDQTTVDITGQTLSALFAGRRLFYADHSNFSSLARPTDGKYAAACDAYFYISPASGDFLPLAVRTNTNTSLVYTPKDSADDWLLAKIMFNVDDFFMAQFDHFARNHFTTEIMYEAAIRTMSDSHPVLAILSRSFGIRPLALLVLLRPGGDVDNYFGYTGAAAAQFADSTYANGVGAIQANYFRTNLQRRGLINSTGPPLKSFPFYEDAAPLFDAIRDFTGSFVNSYYPTAGSIAVDTELQAFITEANGPAGVLDFPKSITTPSALADFLAEFAQHTSISHHAVNLNQLITSAAVLPFHPTALYKPIPTAKGTTNIASYLPPLDKCLGITSVAANFARPLLAATNRSMVHMFDDPLLLARTNGATRAANEKLKAALRARSAVVKARGFDAQGLSQGMPFVWKALDPDVVPWSLTI